MSHLYTEVLKTIYSKVSPLKLFTLQFLQLLLYCLLSIILYASRKITFTYKEYFVILFILFGIRIYYLNIKISLYSIISDIKYAFSKNDRETLLTEIDDSLKNSVEFTKWSCGILATILLFVSNKLMDFPNLKLSTNIEISITPISLFFFIIGCLILYYLIVQIFNYNKRLTRKILTYCKYQYTYQPPTNSIRHLISDIFCWDIIKNIFKN